MVTKELFLYVKDLIDKGVSIPKIYMTLSSQGDWSSEDVDEVIKSVLNSLESTQGFDMEVVPTSEDNQIEQVEEKSVISSEIKRKDVQAPTKKVKKFHSLEIIKVLKKNKKLLGVIFAILIIFVSIIVVNSVWKSMMKPIDTFIGALENATQYDSYSNHIKGELAFEEFGNYPRFGMDNSIDLANSFNLQNHQIEGSVKLTDDSDIIVLSYRVIDNTLYVKMHTNGNLVPDYLHEFNNKWIEIDLLSLPEQISLNAQVDTYSLIEMRKSFLNLIITLLKNDSVSEILNTAVVVDKKEGRVDGVSIDKYTIELSVEEWDTIIDVIAQGYFDLADREKQTSLLSLYNANESVEEMQSVYNNLKETHEYQTILEVLASSKIDMWFDSRGTRLHQFDMSVDHRNKYFNVDLVLQGEFTNFDELIEVGIPEGDIVDFVEFKRVSLDGARGKANDAYIKASLHRLLPQTTLYFENNENSYNLSHSNANDCSVDIFQDVITSEAIEGAELTSGVSAVCTIAKDGNSWAVSVPFENTDVSYCVMGNDLLYDMIEPYSYGVATGGGSEDSYCDSGSNL